VNGEAVAASLIFRPTFVATLAEKFGCGHAAQWAHQSPMKADALNGVNHGISELNFPHVCPA